MNIRKLTKADVEIYWPMRLRALKEHPDAFGSSYEESCTRSLEDVAAGFADRENFFMLGAFDEDGTLIGMVGFRQESALKMKHKGMIFSMYSAPEHRGKGVGRALMQALIERARALPDLEQINLSVVTSNAAAKNLYESLGFETYGVEKRCLLVDGQYLDEAHMVLFLKQ